MYGLKSGCIDANQDRITQGSVGQDEIEKQTITLGDVLKVGLRILIVIEMSYAMNQNTEKYYQYIDKIIME